jgi:hypothetical protein
LVVRDVVVDLDVFLLEPVPRDVVKLVVKVVNMFATDVANVVDPAVPKYVKRAVVASVPWLLMV